MRIFMMMQKGSVDKFNSACTASIMHVARGTKKATEAACKEILQRSLAQVPRDTNTLANSASYTVYRRTDVGPKTWSYAGEIGYALEHNPVNPRTGLPASRYAALVHEDLSAYHPHGKAKFLEDPAREYAEENFSRHVASYWGDAIRRSGGR